MAKKYDFMIILEDDYSKKDFFSFVQKIIKYQLDKISSDMRISTSINSYEKRKLQIL